MEAPACVVHLGGREPHLSQIAAGFTLLHQQKQLRVRFGGFLPAGAYPHKRVLRAAFEDGPVLWYDLADGFADIPRDALDACLEGAALCFKRSFDPADHQGMRHRTKIRPLGLNYHVTCKGSFFPQAGAPTAEEYMSHNSYPAYRGLFVTRLLEGDGKEIEEINAFRIACLRACQKKLGERFVGGLLPEKTARALAPEFIFERTGRADCLRLRKENFVCVTTEGPQRSLGWGIAECLAAGRAVLCPPPRFHLPGRFAKGRNFGAFETPEGCAELLRQALDTVPWIHRMEEANFAYYQNYVMPAAIVRQSLKACGLF